MAPGLRRRVTNRITKRYQPALEEQVTKHWRDADTAKAQRRLYQGWRQLPLDRRLVVFEANLGTIYGDSPKYVYEAMRRLHPQMKAVWVLPPDHEPPHPDVEVVERGSAAYRRVLARAAYWVDNQTFPSYIRKRPEQRYLQTWHGIPLKKMGHDEPGAPPPPPQPDRGVGAWDELCVPNRYFEETFVPAYRYAGGLVRYGTPRNDALVDGSMTQQEARRLLDLPQDARVVLYAPTFRQDNRSKRLAVEVPFDVEAFLEGMDDNTYLLLRPHYLNRIRVPASVRHRTLDTASVEDVNILYHAADVLVTDYSSVMFDYALLRKPIVFYTYDYGEYLATRGTYFDLLEVGPGPFVTTTRELVAAVASAQTDRAEYAAKYQHFLERYCGDEDGSASERAVRALLGEAGAP
nr:CDP-glycerol glycerophosphotransferase family protein [Knoellia sp. DB2414S]